MSLGGRHLSFYSRVVENAFSNNNQDVLLCVSKRRNTLIKKRFILALKFVISFSKVVSNLN